VIAPVLAAIGAYDCKWPPYASHIEFELWQTSNATATASAFVRVSCYNSLSYQYLLCVHCMTAMLCCAVLQLSEQHHVLLLAMR
jgi:hypothetical protein